MNQYLVFPYGKLIDAPSYLAARRQADERWGGITATTVLRLEMSQTTHTDIGETCRH